MRKLFLAAMAVAGLTVAGTGAVLPLTSQAGAPIGSYQKDGKPVPVKPGPSAKIKASFDDSVRWK